MLMVQQEHCILEAVNLCSCQKQKFIKQAPGSHTEKVQETPQSETTPFTLEALMLGSKCMRIG